MKFFDGFLQNKKESFIQVILVIGILITLNYLFSGTLFQLDLTQNHEYTLSQPSKNIAKSIKDPITVTAYFSSKLPPQLASVQKQFKDLLEEFRKYSGDNIEYKFVDPNKNKAAEMKAQHSGIGPVMVDVRKRDQMSQKKAYLGAEFEYDGKTQVIPLIQPGMPLEYKIASTIKKLIIKKKPKIGLLEGNGELSRNNMPELMQALDQEFDVKNVTGLDTTAVPADINVLMILRPQKKLDQKVQKAIDQYIMSGGKVIFAINKVTADMQRGYAMPADYGIDNLLASYHLPINSDLIRDLSASTINITQHQGGFNFVNQVRYPYMPEIINFSDNPITKGLEAVALRYTSSLDTTLADTAQKIVVLATSSKRSGKSKGYMNVNPFQKWQQSQFNDSYIPVAAMISGKFRSAFANNDSVHVRLKESVPTSLIVIGNGDFIDNGPPRQQHRLPGDNINLMVNSVDYLADDTGLMALRTKATTNRPLEIVEDSTKMILKYVNVFFPIIIVLGYGFYRYEKRKSQRRRWMEDGL